MPFLMGQVVVENSHWTAWP